MSEQHVHEHELHEARWELLDHINNSTDKFMIALAFVWLLLLIIDFTVGLNPLLQRISDVIWVIFIADFIVEFIVAPEKKTYLRKNWLTAVSLMLPALRLLRIFRALRILRATRTVRTVSLLRLMTSVNRGMRAVVETLGRRNIGYVLAITVIVIFAGAAGMTFFERPQALYEAGYTSSLDSGEGIQSYSDAVWWTAMVMTTLGSEYWPVTVEGRILCWILSLYAVGVFGYLTAAFASHFIGLDKRTNEPTVQQNEALRQDIASLEARMQVLLNRLEGQQ